MAVEHGSCQVVSIGAAAQIADTVDAPGCWKTWHWQAGLIARRLIKRITRAIPT